MATRTTSHNTSDLPNAALGPHLADESGGGGCDNDVGGGSLGRDSNTAVRAGFGRLLRPQRQRLRGRGTPHLRSGRQVLCRRGWEGGSIVDGCHGGEESASWTGEGTGGAGDDDVLGIKGSTNFKKNINAKIVMMGRAKLYQNSCMV